METETLTGTSPATKMALSLLVEPTTISVVIKDTQEPATGNILRGQYCLAITAMEVYFTYLGFQLGHALLTKRSSSVKQDSINSEYRSSLRALGCKRPRGYAADAGQLREYIYSDFSSVTLNRPNSIHTIIGLGFLDLDNKEDDSSSQKFSTSDWDEFSKLVARLTGFREWNPMLNLAVDRRNEIVHSGDFQINGFSKNAITDDQVNRVQQLVKGIILAAENVMWNSPLLSQSEANFAEGP